MAHMSLEMIGDCGVVGRIEQCWSNILISAFIGFALLFDMNYRVRGVSCHYFGRTNPLAMGLRPNSTMSLNLLFVDLQCLSCACMLCGFNPLSGCDGDDLL